MIATLSIISLLLTAFYLMLLVYLIKGWSKLPVTLAKSVVFKTKVTILIAARNEAEKIHLTIEDILAQDYPKNLVEVIIVDDHSTDDTAAIIRSYSDRGIKLLQLAEDKPLNSYKKKAITEAIGLSTGELMVATDADCRMGITWLSSIVQYFESEDMYMISSPVTFFEERTLFELLQTLEFSYLIGIGAASIGHRHASTCNGANLAYRKDIFYEVGGFKGIDELASGDDELLLQKVAERYPGKIGFLKKSEAIVYTHAKPTLKEFIQQRIRWASKSIKYKDKKVIALGLCFWCFNLSIMINALAGFYDIIFLKLFAAQILLKGFVELFYIVPIMSFFKRTYLVCLVPVLTPLHIVYIVIIGFIGNNKKYQWKGRTVR